MAQGSHFASTKALKPYWQVSTDVSTRNTAILFMDENQQVIYKEVLPQQYVKLTSRNRRFLDRFLTRLTSNQLVSNRLKTNPIPANDQGLRLPIAEFSKEGTLDQNRTTGTTSLMTSVRVMNCKMVRVWWSGTNAEKITVKVTSPMGRIVDLMTAKVSESAYVIPIQALWEGIYDISLAGLTWEKKYELHIRRERELASCEVRAY